MRCCHSLRPSRHVPFYPLLRHCVCPWGYVISPISHPCSPLHRWSANMHWCQLPHLYFCSSLPLLFSSPPHLTIPHGRAAMSVPAARNGSLRVYSKNTRAAPPPPPRRSMCSARNPSPPSAATLHFGTVRHRMGVPVSLRVHSLPTPLTPSHSLVCAASGVGGEKDPGRWRAFLSACSGVDQANFRAQRAVRFLSLQTNRPFFSFTRSLSSFFPTASLFPNRKPVWADNNGDRARENQLRRPVFSPHASAMAPPPPLLLPLSLYTRFFSRCVPPPSPRAQCRTSSTASSRAKLRYRSAPFLSLSPSCI